MSEGNTQNPPDGRSFEERIFARFDAIDARLNGIDSRLNDVDARLDRMEARMDRMEARMDSVDVRLSDMDERLNSMDARLQVLEQKAYDAKPIWERALAEILALGEKIGVVERKLGVFWRDMLTLRSEQERLEARLDKLEPKPAT